MCAAWLLKKERHVSVDLLITRLSTRVQTLLSIFTSAIGAAICGAIIWYGSLATLASWQRGMYTATVLEVPVAYLMVIILAGSLLLFIQFARRAHRHLINLKSLGRPGTSSQMDLNT